MKSGIYIITNIINNKKYVGSSKNLSKRKIAHFLKLYNNNHPNIHLQASYNKYGKDVFIFNIIEHVEDITELVNREQYWIDILKPEYNKRLIANSNLGSIFSEFAKLNMSKAMTGEGNNFFGKSHSTESKEKMKLAKLGKKLSEDHKTKILLKHQKKTFQYTLEGLYVNEYVSLKETAEKNNFNYKYFIDQIKKNNGKFKNYYWLSNKEAIKDIINFVR